MGESCLRGWQSRLWSRAGHFPRAEGTKPVPKRSKLGEISKFLLDFNVSQLVLEPVKSLDHVLPKAEGAHQGERKDLH